MTGPTLVGIRSAAPGGRPDRLMHSGAHRRSALVVAFPSACWSTAENKAILADEPRRPSPVPVPTDPCAGDSIRRARATHRFSGRPVWDLDRFGFPDRIR